jgi:hypothetical protein
MKRDPMTRQRPDTHAAHRPCCPPTRPRAAVYTVGEAWLSNAGLPEDAVATAPALVPLFREHPAVSLDVGW